MYLVDLNTMFLPKLPIAATTESHFQLMQCAIARDHDVPFSDHRNGVRAWASGLGIQLLAQTTVFWGQTIPCPEQHVVAVVEWSPVGYTRLTREPGLLSTGGITSSRWRLLT